MNKFIYYSLIVVGISIGTPSLHAVYSQLDLDTAYATVQKNFQSYTDTIHNGSSLSNEQKATLVQQISNNEEQVKEVYQAATRTIGNFNTQGKSPRIVALISSSAQKAIIEIKRIDAFLYTKIQPFIKDESTTSRAAQFAQEQKLAITRRAFELTMRNLMQGLQATVRQLNATVATMRSALPLILKDGTLEYNATAIQSVHTEFEQAAQNAVKAYAAFPSLFHPQDPNNVLVDVFAHWTSFYRNILQQETNAIRLNQKNSSLYYQLLKQLAQHIIGIPTAQDAVQHKGYWNVIEDICSTYAPTLSAVKKSFQQMLVNQAYQPLRIGFTRLVSSISSPTVADISNSVLYYQALKLLMSSASTAVAQQQMQEIETSRGLLYANYVKTILEKDMQVGLNNSTLRQQAQEAYAQAGEAFIAAGDQTQGAVYTAKAQALTQATNFIIQATTSYKNNDKKSAQTAYTQALSALALSNDTADAAFVSEALATLQVQQNQDDISNTLKEFRTQNGEQFNRLTTYLVQGEPTNPLNLLSSIGAVQKAIQTLQALSSAAINRYTALNITTLPGLEQQAVFAKQNNALGLLVSVLNSLQQAVSLAQDGTENGLQMAENAYQNARNGALALDQSFIQSNALSFLTYANLISGQGALTYTDFIDRITAQLYVWLAKNSTDGMLAAHYYRAAQLRSSLPASLAHAISNGLASVVIQQQKLVDLKNKAAQQEQTAQKLSDKAWQVQGTPSLYSSVANTTWKNVLSDYWSAYSLGDSSSFDPFINAARSYKNVYELKVPSVWFPFIGSMLIEYSICLALRKVGKGVEADHEEESILKPLMRTVLQQGEQLIASIASSVLTDNSLKNFTALQQWNLSMQNFTQQQESVLLNYRGPDNSTLPRLITVTLNANGETVYHTDLINSSVTIPRLSLQKGILYKQLAEQAVQQEKYAQAQLYYKTAQESYAALNDATQTELLTAAYQQATTLLYAQYYENSIKPQGSAVIGGIQNVPLTYELNAYGLSVPLLLAQTFPPAQQLTTQTQRTAFELTLAGQLFLYNSLAAHFTAPQVQTILALLSSTASSSIEESLQQAGFGTTDQSIILSTIQNTAAFNQDLKARVTSQHSTLVLQTLAATPPQQPTYKLWEYNKPIPRLSSPLDPPPYNNYPNAYIYYVLASNLYGPTAVQMGSSIFVPGNRPNKVVDLKQKMVQLWLSQGYEMQQKIDTLKKSPQFQALTKISKDDTTVSLDSYGSLYATIRDYYGRLDSTSPTVPYPLLISYSTPLSLPSLVDPNSSLATSLKNLVAQSYKQAGDALSLFLVGNPLDSTYAAFLNEVATYYTTAISIGGYDATLYLTIGDLYRTAGRTILYTLNNYFGSTTNLLIAQEFYAKAPLTDPLTQKRERDILVDIVTGEFLGATQSVNFYKQKRFQSFSVQNLEGEEISMNFQDLAALYWNSVAGTSDLSTAQQAAWYGLKEDLLNAMIFYGYVASQLHNGGSTAPTQDVTVEKEAQDLFSTYCKEHTLDLTTASGMLTVLEGSSFVQEINQFFTQCLQNFSTATDQKSRSVQLRAAGIWADHLYTGFGFVYMSDLLGGVSATTWTTLTADIKARTQGMANNAAQAIG